MIWKNDKHDGMVSTAEIPGFFLAIVYRTGERWFSEVTTPDDSYCFWNSDALPSEAAAKDAVVAWMDGVVWKLQNAKVAGCQPVDEE